MKHLEKKKSFYGEIKGIFITFIGFSVAKICLRPTSGPLRNVWLSDGANLQLGNVKLILVLRFYFRIFRKPSIQFCINCGFVFVYGFSLTARLRFKFYVKQTLLQLPALISNVVISWIAANYVVIVFIIYYLRNQNLNT